MTDHEKQQEDLANANYEKQIAQAVTQGIGPLQVHYVYPPVPLDVAVLRGIIREEILMALPAYCQAMLDFLLKNGMVLYACQPQKEPTLDEREI
jgi:hypothetical protein